MSKLNEIIPSLDPELIQEIYTPTEVGRLRIALPIRTLEEPSESLEGGTETQVTWLHAEIDKSCYVVYSKYKYRAWTTSDSEGKNKIKVDSIKLEMDSGNGRFSKSKDNVNEVKKLDEVYGTGNTCHKAHLYATATVNGRSWSVEVKH